MSQLVLHLCLRHITILYLSDVYAPFMPLIVQIIPFISFLLVNDFNFTVAWEVNGVSTGKAGRFKREYCLRLQNLLGS